MPSEPQHWLVKSEPDCFSIQHLAACPKQTTAWSGVRNYQARNFMRAMRVGDRVLYYHSSCEPPTVAGTALVVRPAYPDHTALDPRDDHFDSKASKENPIWEMVDIRLDEIFATPVRLPELRAIAGLNKMELLRRGSRLSVQPVRPSEFEIIVRLGRASAGAAPAPAAKKAPARRTTPAAKPVSKRKTASRR